MKIIDRERGILLKPASLLIKIKHLSYLTNTHFIVKARYCLKVGGRLKMIPNFHRRFKDNAGNYSTEAVQEKLAATKLANEELNKDRSIPISDFSVSKLLINRTP